MEFAASFKRCCGKGRGPNNSFDNRRINTVRMTTLNSSRCNIHLTNADKNKITFIKPNEIDGVLRTGNLINFNCNECGGNNKLRNVLIDNVQN